MKHLPLLLPRFPWQPSISFLISSPGSGTCIPENHQQVTNAYAFLDRLVIRPLNYFLAEKHRVGEKPSYQIKGSSCRMTSSECTHGHAWKVDRAFVCNCYRGI
ncbi:hypothetical protein B0O99DRAFT_605135 [Bisporella sp. PMI_857]|nr:hypothetical protein B0O99DRAFT_605135 [Bisporella sp. PMI_857]